MIEIGIFRWQYEFLEKEK